MQIQGKLSFPTLTKRSLRFNLVCVSNVPSQLENRKKRKTHNFLYPPFYPVKRCAVLAEPQHFVAIHFIPPQSRVDLLKVATDELKFCC